MTFTFHPVADIFPRMSTEEFTALKADIAANGLHEAIWVKGDAIIDGRHRYRACNELAIACGSREYEGDDPLGFVISLNLKRRHLNESQRAMVAAKLAQFRIGDNQHSEGTPIGRASVLLNVGDRSIARARVVQEQGAPELITAVEQGTVSVAAAADVAELPKTEQQEIVARGEKEILQAAKNIRVAKGEEQRKKNAVIRETALAVEIPRGKYRCIVIDPPWPVQKYERDCRPNQTGDLDYPTMPIEEICKFDIDRLVAEDECHLFCWTTQKHLPATFEILEAWDFNYVFCMVWHKPGGPQPFNLPQYNCEFVLYGRKGSASFLDTKQFFTCFDAPRREHSRKPNEFYELIKRVCPGPRIDVFSRELRDGFAQYGNEPSKFAA